MTLREELQEIITGAIEQAVKDGKLPETMPRDVKVEYPREDKFGDYATPVAMESARIIKRNPLETGEILKQYIQDAPMVDQVDVVKPGFINIFINHDSLIKITKSVLKQGDFYGKQKKKEPQTINIEFVSANPTGPMNVVSARAAALGDTLANLFEATGDTVEREYYVNDYGNQVRLLGESVKSRIDEKLGRETTFPEEGYRGEYIYDIADHILEQNDGTIDKLEGDDLIDFLAREAVAYNVQGQKTDLEAFNVRYTRWFREAGLHSDGKVEETRQYLEDQGHLYNEDNKTFFKSSDYGDDKDRVVVRDDGRPTYLLADIAYHRDKVKRGYDKIINIWGPDHHGYIARLSAAMEIMGYGKDTFQVLIAQQVNLIMEGETVKMSKRLGNFSTMKDLLEEIGRDVARYFFVMRSMDSHLDFDLALAKKQSSENPVFYLQYAHARICSLFRKAEEQGVPTDLSVDPGKVLDNDEAMVVMKLLARYPEEVLDAATTAEPHRITTFLMRLAQSFHRFYTEHRIITDDTMETSSHLVLCQAVKITMKNGLTLLGVSAPERM